MFKPVDQTPDFPGIDAEVLHRWESRDVFAESLRLTENGPLFRFYEGPPTANGHPGVHHIEARVFKDLFPRYRTMKGYRVPRRAGWDCHGIPVELEVERELGFSSKHDIEAYGIQAFNDQCRKSVERYVAEFDALTRRIGYWVDTTDAYWTMSDTYIDSVWWSLKKLFDAGLMTLDHRVTPYCPRCGTGLSDHEVAQGYREVEDLSVFVRLPIISGPLASAHDGGPIDLLVWTTMPWTFVATTAAVIGPNIDYVVAQGGAAGERPVVIARNLVTAVLGEDARSVRDVDISDLLGQRYQGPFDLVGPGSPADPSGDPASWRIIVAGDFVTLDQGSGIVSTGAAFGEDDMRVAKEAGLPVVNPVNTDGTFNADCGPFAGLDVREADASIVAALEDNGLLVRSHWYKHSYPFCWRCATPLIYYAKPSWYIRTTRRRDTMMRDNAMTAWLPEHIRSGRYGDWLRNNVDWALSRERYWGTPLPLWKCVDCDTVRAVGSRRELAQLSGRREDDIDMHRPGIDDVAFGCAECGGECRRVTDVIDAWYDSGAMPFAQHGYPHLKGSEEAFVESHPADYVCEGIDQTRGWFYSLQAISTLAFDSPAYSRALCLGHIVDQHGRKMSKSAGNVLDPFALLDHFGADAVRWLFIAEGNPWQPRRVGEGALRDVTRQLLLPLWNTYYFFTTYANLAGWEPHDIDAAGNDHILDRYILAELTRLVADVDASMEGFDSSIASGRIIEFVDALSNWYLRLSRARFGPTAEPRQRSEAFQTLHFVLLTLTKLLAPFTPFVADEIYEGLVSGGRMRAKSSVHLEGYPTATELAPADEQLLEAMSHARALVTLGRSARVDAGVPIRQPLSKAFVGAPRGHEAALLHVRDLIAGELNVRTCEFASDSQEHTIALRVKPNFRELGKRYAKRTPAVAQALAAFDGDAAAAELDATGSLAVEIAGERLVVDAECIDFEQRQVTGWQATSDGAYTVALDTQITQELRRDGWARELSRGINELRKQSGLALGQMAEIVLSYPDDAPQIDLMLSEHGQRIATEVQAKFLKVDPSVSGAMGRISLDGVVVVTEVRAAS